MVILQSSGAGRNWGFLLGVYIYTYYYYYFSALVDCKQFWVCWLLPDPFIRCGESEGGSVHGILVPRLCRLHYQLSQPFLQQWTHQHRGVADHPIWKCSNPSGWLSHMSGNDVNSLLEKNTNGY